MAIKQIPIDQIRDNPFQPRTEFDRAALASLADEMKAGGVWSGALQARPGKNGHWQLVFGHRRLRALKLLHAKTVTVEIVDLTDAQMALRSLEENLQREGLTDLEKADGVKAAVELAQNDLRAAGKNESHAAQQVADRLGLSYEWVRTLSQISTTMVGKNRAPIEAGYITAKTAFQAKTWGGDAYMNTLARQGKAAAAGEGVPKPTHMTVQAMRKVVEEAPEGVREKLKAAIVEGEVTTPAEAAQKGRRLAAERTKRNKLPPSDLRIVIVDWTHRLEDWDRQLKDAIPYMDYVDEVPAIATAFRAALTRFIGTAQRVLDVAAPALKSVGKGSTAPKRLA
jgi:ParB/RepB/Spo0J family partition protein